MKIHEELKDRVMTLTLKGAFNDLTGSSIRDKFEKALSSDEVDTIYCDLSDVSYVSSAGICVLMIAYKRSIKVGKKIFIKKMSQKVNEIFSTVGILPLFSDEEKES